MPCRQLDLRNGQRLFPYDLHLWCVRIADLPHRNAFALRGDAELLRRRSCSFDDYDVILRERRDVRLRLAANDHDSRASTRCLRDPERT